MALATDRAQTGGRPGRGDAPEERTSYTGTSWHRTQTETADAKQGHLSTSPDMIDKLGLWVEPALDRSADRTDLAA
ncbi:hypothetical protein AB0J84_22700 [Micromonospora arborensis]|uniref:hypothetical protein n=1 Tax=Micromonospora arborensis TaxID=2116518 RepID=UPI0034220938